MSLIVDIKKKIKDFYLDISFETNGDYLGILGASGSGKSMTLKCIAGIETPDEGIIILNGKVLFDSKNNINLKTQERNVGYLFQNYALFPHMTVEENIGIGLKLPKNEKSQKVKEMIQSFQLDGLEKKYPNKLSGGQQQRVAFARSSIYKPDILMLDEPFSALDSYLKDQLQNEFWELLKLYDGEVLMVSHRKNEIYRFCKKLAIFHKGKSILHGETKEIFRQPKSPTAAKLIGCKNISKCHIIDSNRIYASDWDIILETNQIISERINHVGIQSHELEIINVVKGKDEKNLIEFRINNISEDAFEYNLLLIKKGIKKENINSEILYKVNKKDWKNKKINDTLFLKIPESSILLLE